MTSERDTRPARHPSGDAAHRGEITPGTLLGDYRLGAPIARGGCGTVYEAEHRLLGRRAAIKVLHRELAGSPEMVERFVREARAVNRIAHPHIVDIYDFGETDDGIPYYVMELIVGARDLHDVIAAEGPFSASEVVALVTPICEALGAAHQAGVVHRDLKPRNVIVASSGEHRTVKLHDFGIAKLLEPDALGLTRTGERLGTPHAMSPEQLRGTEVDERTDIYALGVMLFQLLTGTYPFEGERPEEIEWMHLEAEPPRPSEIVPEARVLDDVVLRCLAKEPGDRFGEPAAVLTALREALASTDGRTTEVDAIAVLVAVELPDDVDDRLLDSIDDALEEIESLLAAAGFADPLRTGDAVLAFAARDGQLLARCAPACHRAAELLETAGARARVCVHVAPGATTGGRVTGGAIARSSTWAPGPGTAGVWATSAAAKELGLDAPPSEGGAVALPR